MQVLKLAVDVRAARLHPPSWSCGQHARCWAQNPLLHTPFVADAHWHVVPRASRLPPRSIGKFLWGVDCDMEQRQFFVYFVHRGVRLAADAAEQPKPHMIPSIHMLEQSIGCADENYRICSIHIASHSVAFAM